MKNILHSFNTLHGHSKKELFDLRVMLDSFSSYGSQKRLAKPLNRIAGQVGPWELRWNREKTGIDWTLTDESNLKDHHLYKARDIQSKKTNGSPRVILIGESAAGSYGYWGDFSLASSIESQIKHHGGECEVIDLTCINASWKYCNDIMKQSMTLDPDVIIFYVGNNQIKSLVDWLGQGMINHHKNSFSTRWSSIDNPHEYTRELNELLISEVNERIDETEHLAKHYKKELFFVIPEYNLADWRPKEMTPLGVRSEDLNQWWEAINEAEYSLESRRYDDAIEHFSRATEIDESQCQRSAYGLGKAWHALGKSEEAKYWFEKARDCGPGPFVAGFPQLNSTIINHMRKRYGRRQLSYIDMPKILEDSSSDGVTGKHHFIDYCHLSDEGINTVASNIGKTVTQDSKFFEAKEVDGDYQVPISPKDESLASLVAAIHNFHYGQDIYIVRYWLRKAHESWAGMAPILDFLASTVASYWRERFTVESLGKTPLGQMMGTRYFYFICKYFYHTRFDLELLDLILEITGRLDERTSLLRSQAGHILDGLDGDLYSLFFLDRLRGIKPRYRSAGRIGLETPDLDLCIYEPKSIVEFPLFDQHSPRVLTLEIILPTSFESSNFEIYFNDVKVCHGELRPGSNLIEQEVNSQLLKPEGIQKIRLDIEKGKGMFDYGSLEEKMAFKEQIGQYPIYGKLKSISFKSR